jgi:hypothetical protein
METMLANGYQPTRTVVLASGFDEESSGLQVRGSSGVTPIILKLGPHRVPKPWQESFSRCLVQMDTPCWSTKAVRGMAPLREALLT